VPDRDTHRHSLGGESLDDTPTEEAGAAKHADRGHGIPFGMLDKIDPSTAFHGCSAFVVEMSDLDRLRPVGKLPILNSRKRPQSKPSSFVEIIGSLSGRNSS
jgi:hypothetical protein